MKHINSRHNAAVTRYRDAARGTDAAILLDGVHLVEDALAAGIPIRHAVVARDKLGRDDVDRLVSRLVRHGAEMASASAGVIAAVSPVRSASALVALADRPSRLPDAVYAGHPRLIVIACDIQDAGNLGAIVRVAEAGGASGLIAAGRCADPFGWKTLRGSMGSALRLPLARQSHPQEAVALAQRCGCRIVATIPRDGTSLFDADLEPSLAILIGGEGQGLSDAIVAVADQRVTIPMEPPVESLNAAVSAALVVYEARRQRAPRANRNM